MELENTHGILIVTPDVLPKFESSNGNFPECPLHAFRTM